MDKIYINLTTEGNYTPEYKQKIVYKTLCFMPKILKITSSEYAKIFGTTKQSINKYYHGNTITKLLIAYSFATINTQFLQEKFKDQKDINIDKICDILYINTDNYTEDQIKKTFDILILLSSYKNYKNILVEIINKL